MMSVFSYAALIVCIVDSFFVSKTILMAAICDLKSDYSLRFCNIVTSALYCTVTRYLYFSNCKIMIL